MSRTISATNGHVGVFAGGAGVDGPLIGLQVEDQRGSKSLTAVRLTLPQARELALELLERVYPPGRPAGVEDVIALIRGLSV